MSFIHSIKNFFLKGFDFKTRASRSEYWYAQLFLFSMGFLLGLIENLLGLFPDTPQSVLANIFTLIILIPSYSVLVRRLHDVGRSGWWILTYLIIIGVILILYWTLKRGTVGSNKYGSDPIENSNPKDTEFTIVDYK